MHLRKLTLVRHGQTDQNLRQELQGRQDTLLNPTGREQAKKVVFALRSQEFNQIWTSPLKRAVHTANAINLHHKQKLIIEPDLIERSFGEYECRPVAQLRAFERLQNVPPGQLNVPGAESMTELYQRGQRLLSGVSQTSAHSLCLVAHAGIFRALIGGLLNQQEDKWCGMVQSNVCINSFRFNEHGELVAWHLNDTTHCDA